MSVYSLGLMGGMPFGSAVLGWCVGVLGARNAVLVPVIGMAVVQLLIFTTSRLWLVERRRGAYLDEEPLMSAAD